MPLRPWKLGRLEFTRLAPCISALDVIVARSFARRLVGLLQEKRITVVHTIPHTADFWPAFKAARKAGVRFALSAHDDLRYNQAGSPVLSILEKWLGHVWRESDVRFSISEELGEEYNLRFGKREFIIVTDGVSNVGSKTQIRSPSSIRVHFGGAFHMSYRRNFDALVTALNRVKAANPALDVHLTIRGSEYTAIAGAVNVTALPWSDQATFERDLREADFLYLPLPFERQYQSLSKFSLSTKMISYLASGTPIIYHGPVDAAAARVLLGSEAALCATEPTAEALIPCLLAPPVVSSAIADRGRQLAADRFCIEHQRRKFWDALFPKGS